MKKTILLSLISSFYFLAFLYADASDYMQGSSAGWKAGVARVVITPEQSMWMAGYAARDHASEGTLVDLWAKTLVLEDAYGKQAVVITTDLIGFPKDISDRIKDRLKAKFGLSRSQIILNSSHTHSGPVLQPDIYPLDSFQLKKVEQYCDNLDDQIVNLVGKALHSLEPVHLYSQNGITRFQVNRRNNIEAKLNPQTELKGPNDYAVPVIKVVNMAGNLMAVAFGYACHNTVLEIYKWSGDYAGFAQIELEKLHPGITALFLQGAGADQNPLPRGTVPLAQQYGRELAAAVERVLNEEMRQLFPQLSTEYSEVDLQFANPPPTKEKLSQIMEASFNYPDYLKRNAKVLLEKIEHGDSLMTSYPYPVQVWKLGDQLIISLAGEPVIEYAIKLKKTFGQDIFVLGYSNDVMSYIPSTMELKEGGYEGSRSVIFTTPWVSNIEMVIIQEVMRLAEKAGVKNTNTHEN